MSEGANSGLMYHVSEAFGAAYETGPEYQILDDAKHGDGKNPKTTKLGSVMSRPLKVIKASDKVESAASALRANKIKRLPVVDRKGKLVGIVTEGDLLRVYPGMVDVVSEMQEIRQSKPNEYYTGTCDICGCFSEELRRDESKLKCEECIEEDSV